MGWCFWQIVLPFLAGSVGTYLWYLVRPEDFVGRCEVLKNFARKTRQFIGEVSTSEYFCQTRSIFWVNMPWLVLPWAARITIAVIRMYLFGETFLRAMNAGIERAGCMFDPRPSLYDHVGRVQALRPKV